MDYIIDKKAIIYFHNLKFDFSYILWFLLKKNVEFNICEKQGTIYSVSFKNIELRDSMNLFPKSLEAFCKAYNKTYFKYKLDNYLVDYDHIPTKKEVNYGLNDVFALKEAVESFFDTMRSILREVGALKTLRKVGKKLTNSGLCYEAFKELSNLEKLCPKTTREKFELYREAYKGGYVYSNNMGIVENVTMLDENSMYPDKYANYPLPVGEGIELKESQLGKFRFYIIKCSMRYELKEGYPPIIGGGVSRYGGINYKASSNGEYEEMTLCSIDLNLIKEFYDIDMIFIWAKGYRCSTGIFKRYAEIFVRIKNENPSGSPKRDGAKIMLNSPYGKTAMSGKNEIKRYYLDEDTVMSELIGVEMDDEQLQYIEIAIAITAWSRYDLLKTGLKIGFKDVLYMDTDSIKHKGKNPENLILDDNKLGFWKFEGCPRLFKTIAPKKYIYWDEKGYIHFACAGFNQEALYTHFEIEKKDDKYLPVTRERAIEIIESFDKGLEIVCNQSLKVKGGRLIKEVVKIIK